MIFKILGPAFAVFFIIIWITVFVTIIKTISKQSKTSRQVHDTVNTILKEVHTGDPKNPYSRVYKGPTSQGSRQEAQTADDFSEVKAKDSDTFGSDLNPKSPPLRKSNRVSRTTKINGRTARQARVFGIDTGDSPAHGKLSKETRDDEKEWF